MARQINIHGNIRVPISISLLKEVLDALDGTDVEDAEGDIVGVGLQCAIEAHLDCKSTCDVESGKIRFYKEL